MNSERVKMLNQIAMKDFDFARTLLDAINEKNGTKYGWLAKRIVRFNEPDCGNVARMYAGCNDLYAELAIEEERTGR